VSYQLVVWFSLYGTLKQTHGPRDVPCLHPLHPFSKGVLVGQVRVVLLKLVPLEGMRERGREGGRNRERVKS
jgi:hypothetical protein